MKEKGTDIIDELTDLYMEITSDIKKKYIIDLNVLLNVHLMHQKLVVLIRHVSR